MHRRTWEIKFQACLVCLLAGWPAPLLGAEQGSQEAKRLVTVQDCIQMARLADAAYHSGGSPKGRVAQFSPDGRLFLVVLKKGNLDQNAQDYSLLLFQTAQAFDSPKPKVLLTLSSSSNRPAISGVKWLNDDTVAFLGEKLGGVPQVYTINASDGRLQQLTDHPTPIIFYDITARGQKLLYAAEPPKKSGHPGEAERKGLVIGTQFLEEILAGDSLPFHATIQQGEQLFIKLRGRPPQYIPMEDVLLPQLPAPSLSPHGRFAIVTVFLRSPPGHWTKYEDALVKERVVAKRMQGVASGVPAYLLLDLMNGKLSPLLDAPLALFPRHSEGFAWAPDGHSVVVSGTFLPLDVTDPLESELRKKTTYVIELKLSEREITKITDRELKVTRWDKTRNIIHLKSNYSTESAAYSKGKSGWEKVSSTFQHTFADPPIEVTLDENMNTPPRILVSEPGGKRRSLLLDLNPQFTKLRFAKVESVSWKAKDGHEVLGGLYLPPDHVAANRYPLVIQTHGFDPSRFMIDGPWGGGAFSAQPLASRGFVVLQVGASKDRDEDRKYINTTQEGPREMAAYEGAIDYLAARGIADPSRVGIVGFSRTVYTVKYALAHSKYRFAAATVADGIDAGYFSYITFPNKDYENLNGGPPFGESLQLWLKNSPGFNLDKVRAPVRIEAYSAFSILISWEWYSGLTYLAKPVDFIYLLEGTHLLVKPWQRLASQQGNLDWFSFWLKGEQDPDPAKAEQYARWRELRKKHEANLKKFPDAP